MFNKFFEQVVAAGQILHGGVNGIYEIVPNRTFMAEVFHNQKLFLFYNGFIDAHHDSFNVGFVFGRERMNFA